MSQPRTDDRTAVEPPLLHEMKALNPWQPERDPIALAVLGKLAEELAEASAIVARCIIQGIAESEPVTGKPNADALENELADVAATMFMVIDHYGLHRMRMDRRRDRKIAHLQAWHQLLTETPRPNPEESPVLAFAAWLEAKVKAGHRPLTQDEYFIAQDAFFTAHPGKGPTSTLQSPEPKTGE